ncbi:CpsD/CapB family tyrosine-protein kinase [Actinomadura sp. CNU-125]|uniref:CpsD/CapB family tyrosine-protein kinase n=1 Tax=Actinomadura sp. CNU-125 TaxID=1904961 RepID=UPI0011780A42|nr:CpsD/CapB family tyrosine-protein kinase [Actinomadura sp. CNU-125]
MLRTDIPVFGSTSPGDADRDGTCRRLRNLVFDEDARCVLLAGAPAAAAMPVARELARLCANGGASSMLLVLSPDGTDADVQTSRAFPETANCTRRTVRITDGDRSLREAVARARAEVEIVIITGPELDSVDTLTLATFCDLTVVVAERETTIDVEVARGISVLAETAVPARGLILAEPAGR